MGFTLPKGKEREYRARAGELLPAVLLPAPPSTNALFNALVIGGRARWVPSKEYKTWKADAGPVAARLRSPAAYPVGVRLTLRGKWFKQRDIDNLAKPVLDLLVSTGVLAGDHLGCVGRLTLAHAGDVRNEPMVLVEFDEKANLFGT